MVTNRYGFGIADNTRTIGGLTDPLLHKRAKRRYLRVRMVSATRKRYLWDSLHPQAESAKKEASHVAIPIGEELKRIIDDSRDNVASPFVVHRIPERQIKRSKEVSHPSQVAPDYLSRSFSATRDKLGLCDHLPMDERPTFHEIRALAAHLFDQQGIDPQGRMAHSDAKSTKIYTQNHIDWVVVPHGEIKAS